MAKFDVGSYIKVLSKAALGNLKGGLKKQVGSLDNLEPLIHDILVKNADPDVAPGKIIAALKAELNRAIEKFL
jgi:hypothetical protein